MARVWNGKDDWSMSGYCRSVMRRWYQLSTWIPATTDITLVWSTWQNDAIQRHYSLSAQGVDLLIIIIETKYQTSRPIIILCKYQRLKDSTSTMQWPFYIINWCVLLAMNVWKRSLVWKVEDISKLSLHHLFIELSNQPFIPSLCFSPFLHFKVQSSIFCMWKIFIWFWIHV